MTPPGRRTDGWYPNCEAFAQDRTKALVNEARFILGAADRRHAEDVVQEVLVNVFLNFDNISKKSYPNRYVHVMVANEAKDFWKKKSNGEIPSGLTRLPEPVAPDPSDDVAEQDRFGRAIAQLTPTQRAVMLLKCQHDLSNGQIADALNIDSVTVRSHAHDARRRLRAILRLGRAGHAR